MLRRRNLMCGSSSIPSVRTRIVSRILRKSCSQRAEPRATIGFLLFASVLVSSCGNVTDSRLLPTDPSLAISRRESPSSLVIPRAPGTIERLGRVRDPHHSRASGPEDKRVSANPLIKRFGLDSIDASTIEPRLRALGAAPTVSRARQMELLTKHRARMSDALALFAEASATGASISAREALQRLGVSKRVLTLGSGSDRRVIATYYYQAEEFLRFHRGRNESSADYISSNSPSGRAPAHVEERGVRRTALVPAAYVSSDLSTAHEVLAVSDVALTDSLVDWEDPDAATLEEYEEAIVAVEIAEAENDAAIEVQQIEYEEFLNWLSGGGSHASYDQGRPRSSIGWTLVRMPTSESSGEDCHLLAATSWTTGVYARAQVTALRSVLRDHWTKIIETAPSTRLIIYSVAALGAKPVIAAAAVGVTVYAGWQAYECYQARYGGGPVEGPSSLVSPMRLAFHSNAPASLRVSGSSTLDVATRGFTTRVFHSGCAGPRAGSISLI